MALLKLSALALLVFFGTYSFAQEDDMENVPVVLGKVVSTPTGGRFSLTCEVVPQFSIILSASIDAELITLAPVGQSVSENDIVAAQDSFYIENEIDKNQVLLNSEIKSSELHSQENERTKKQGSLITKSERERFNWQSDLSRNQVTLRNLEIERLKHDLNKATIKVDGLYEVVQHFSKLGQFVMKGDPIAEVVPLEEKEVACEVPLSSGIEDPTQLMYSFNDKILTLSRASSILSEDTQSKTLYFLLTPDIAASIGQRIDIIGTYNYEGLMKVPYDAINYESSGEAYVWLVGENNQAHRVGVDIVRGGGDTKGQTVTSNLPLNGSVVIMGADMLEEGTPVSFTITKD